jgi:hypothetical protein
MLMPKEKLTKSMLLKKEFKDNKSLILPPLPTPTKLPEMMPPPPENTSKKKSK